MDKADEERQTIIRADGSRISLDQVAVTQDNAVDVLLGALSDAQRGRLLRFKDVEAELRESVGVWCFRRTLHADPKSVLALLGYWYTFRGGRNAQYADSTFRSGQRHLLAHMNDRGFTWDQSLDALTPAQALVLGMKVGMKARHEVDAERETMRAVREVSAQAWL